MAATLFRAVGPRELAFVESSGFRALPRPPAWRPSLSLLCEESYARMLAREWCPLDEGEGRVLRLRVREAFLARHPARPVGGTPHLEHRVPAEEVDDLNASLDGPIELV